MDAMWLSRESRLQGSLTKPRIEGGRRLPPGSSKTRVKQPSVQGCLRRIIRPGREIGTSELPTASAGSPESNGGPLASTQKADAHNVLPAALQLDLFILCSFAAALPAATRLSCHNARSALAEYRGHLSSGGGYTTRAGGPPPEMRMMRRAPLSCWMKMNAGSRLQTAAAAHHAEGAPGGVGFAGEAERQAAHGGLYPVRSRRSWTYPRSRRCCTAAHVSHTVREESSEAYEGDGFTAQIKDRRSASPPGCWGECRGAESAVVCVEEANGESIPRVLSVTTSKRRDRSAGRGIDRFAVRRWEDNKVQTENERQKLPVDACREDSAKSSWTRAKRRAPTPLWGRSRTRELALFLRMPTTRREGWFGHTNCWEADDANPGIETAGSGDGSVLTQGGSLHGLLEKPIAGGVDPPVTRTCTQASIGTRRIWGKVVRDCHIYITERGMTSSCGRPPGWTRGRGMTCAGTGAATARATDARAAAMLQALRVTRQLSLPRRRQRHARTVPYSLVIRRGARLLFFRDVIVVIVIVLATIAHSTNDGGRPQIALPIQQGPPSLIMSACTTTYSALGSSFVSRKPRICDNTPTTLRRVPLRDSEAVLPTVNCSDARLHSLLHSVDLFSKSDRLRRVSVSDSAAIDASAVDFTPRDWVSARGAQRNFATQQGLVRPVPAAPSSSWNGTLRGSSHYLVRPITSAPNSTIYREVSVPADSRVTICVRATSRMLRVSLSFYRIAVVALAVPYALVRAPFASREKPSPLQASPHSCTISAQDPSGHPGDRDLHAHERPSATRSKFTLGTPGTRVSHSRSLSQMSSSRAKHSIFSRKWDVSHNTVASYLPWFLFGTCETEGTSAWKVHDFGTRFHGLKSRISASQIFSPRRTPVILNDTLRPIPYPQSWNRRKVSTSSTVQLGLRAGARNQQPKGSAGPAAPAPCAVGVFKPASSIHSVYPAQTGSHIRTFGESAISTIKGFVVCCYQLLVRIIVILLAVGDSASPATSVSPAPTMIIIISEAGRDVYKIGGSEAPAPGPPL
ncbi:hypothetical protein FB451DRAFT_1441683 [Mycena latifolia]|nr:hypothetical protein FB451DRAFT_1441683 [Mycena latifolia]